MLARAQQGDEAAFARLWRDVNPALLRYLSLGGHPADDIAAETWTTVLKGLRRFRGDETGWRAWIFTTGRRRAIDAARHRAREQAGLEAAAHSHRPPEEVGADCADEVLEGLDTVAALRLVATLPPLQAEVVMLRVVAGLPSEVVARMVGRSSGAVRVAGHRGLRRLAELVDRTGVTP